MSERPDIVPPNHVPELGVVPKDVEETRAAIANG